MLIDPPAVPVRPLFGIQLTRQPYTSIDLPCRGAFFCDLLMLRMITIGANDDDQTEATGS